MLPLPRLMPYMTSHMGISRIYYKGLFHIDRLIFIIFLRVKNVPTTY